MKKLLILVTLLACMLFVGCTDVMNNLFPDELPTKDRMIGLWEVTELYDGNDTNTNILDTISLGYSGVKVPTFFYMTEDQDLQSTAGPLFLYMVYGLNNWTTFFGKMDEIFNYVNNKAFTNGQWGIEDSVVETFTIEAKILPPSMQTFTTILDLIPGINTSSLKKYIIHRFIDVSVTVEEGSDTMVWELTTNTSGYYYTQNAQLDQDLWSGWNAEHFSKCKIILTKRVGTLEQKIEEFQ